MADISDGNLRTELAKFGVKIGPITATTRDVYVRKLLRLRGDKPENEAKRSLQSFSSDESDSENNHVNRHHAANNARNLRQRRSGTDLSFKNSKEKEINTSNLSNSNARRSIVAGGVAPLTRRQRALADKTHNKSEFSDNDTDEEFKKDRPMNGRMGINLFKPSAQNQLPQLPRTSTPAKTDHSFHFNKGDSSIKLKNSQFPVSYSRDNYIDSQFRTTDSFPATSNKSQWISMLLVGVTLFFFFALGLVYLGLLQNETGNSTLTSPSALLKDKSDKSDKRHAKIVEMSQNIVTLLQDQAGQHECSLSKLPPSRNMTKQHLQMRLIKENSGDMLCWQEALSLLLNNPNMGVRLLDKFGEHISVYGMEKVKFLEAEKAWKPLWCRLYEAFRKVLYQILLVIAVMVFAGMVISAFAWTWMRKKEERHQVLFMVQRILDVLENHETACKENDELKPYLAIPHVRDMLIPPGERAAMQKIWDKAVKFLEDNESRVRTEFQEIEGENYQVWRWLPKAAESGKPKSRWQGEAFSPSSQGSNSLAYVPSSCLKIRNMFDLDNVFGDKWKAAIEEAIMEKCRDLNAILAIRVDETSTEGCVYMKCKSKEAASQVYKQLHGSWYDGKLVTVKYLRDERFNQRFPDAIGAEKLL